MTAPDRVSHRVTGSVLVPGLGSHLGDPVPMLKDTIQRYQMSGMYHKKIDCQQYV